MENQILLLGTGSGNNEIEEAKRLFYIEEVGFLPINYYIGVDPISDRTRSFGMAMQVFTLGIDIPDVNRVPILYKNLSKYRKLAKRRNRYSRMIKQFAGFYKDVKLIKDNVIYSKDE